jgi:hypothetical protein
MVFLKARNIGHIQSYVKVCSNFSYYAVITYLSLRDPIFHVISKKIPS